MNSKRWWIAGLLFAGTAVNYLDRQTLSVTAPLLRRDFNLTGQDYSHIVAAFMVAYTIMQGVWGTIVDRIGPRIGLAVAMAWWSIAGAAHALAGNGMQLAGARFLLGFGEAGNWPASVKAVNRWFAPQERAFAVGLFNSGSSIGAVIAPPLIAWMTRTYSWRAAFLAMGVVGILWLLPWFSVYRQEVESVEAAAAKPLLREVLSRPGPWAIMIARFFADPVWWFYVFWLPDYLDRARGFSLAQIGAVAWVPFLTAGLGSVSGGALSSLLVRRGVPVIRARFAVMAGGVVLMAFGATAVMVQDLTAMIALISLATFSYSCWAANVLTLPADILEESAVASVSGLSGTTAGLGGTLLTLATGWIVDHFSYGPVFLVAAIMPFAALSAIGWLLMTSRPGGAVPAASR